MARKGVDDGIGKAADKLSKNRKKRKKKLDG